MDNEKKKRQPVGTHSIRKEYKQIPYHHAPSAACQTTNNPFASVSLSPVRSIVSTSPFFIFFSGLSVFTCSTPSRFTLTPLAAAARAFFFSSMKARVCSSSWRRSSSVRPFSSRSGDGGGGAGEGEGVRSMMWSCFSASGRVG